MSKLDDLVEQLKRTKLALESARTSETLLKADWERAQQIRRSEECNLANVKEALLKEVGS